MVDDVRDIHQHVCDERRRPVFKHGDKVRHFKYYRQGIASRQAHEREYEVITHATDTETGKTIVIYRSLADSAQVWARSAESFYSEVDAIKYPDSIQKFRFELIDDEGGTAGDGQRVS